jgi:membrane-associated phospholipid phosphatase
VNSDARLGVVAACALGLTLALGAFVAHRPLTPLDVSSMALRAEATPLAILFTRSGYWQPLVAIVTVLFGLETLARREPVLAVVLGCTQILSQLAVDVLKGIFMRTRPDDWLFHHELGYSFPSGHATTAVLFFGGLLLFFWGIAIPRPLRLAATVVLAIWIVGIPWSRVALRAHYATDVIGGMVFGAAWLCLMIVALRHLPASAVRL